MARAFARRWLFDGWSHVYDVPWVQRAIYRPEHDAVMAILRESPPRIALDVGCGTGQLAHRMREQLRGTRVVGCDFSTGMLRQALARDRGVGWVRGDGVRLPFSSATFDAVVCTEAFHWFPDQGGALREFARVLRPQGRLLLTVVIPPFTLVSLLAATGSRLLGQPFRWLGAAELRRAAAAAGLRVERQTYVLRLPGALLLPPVLTIARRAVASETAGGARVRARPAA